MKKVTHLNENYLVDREGRIYNAKTGKEKSQYLNNHGYMTVDFYRNNKATRYKVHRMVAVAFIPNPDNKRVVNHKDGNKSNNHVDNLEWATDSENQLHAYKTGLRIPNKGEEVGTSV